MILKKISFKTGEFSISDKCLIFNDGQSIASITRNEIGEVFQTPMTVLPKNPINYIFRIAAISAIMFFGGGLMAFLKEITIFLWISIFGLLFSAFLFISFIWIDGLLGFSLVHSILLYLFGIKMIKVSIQNHSGGSNLEFYILESEAKKLPEVTNWK